MTCIDQPVCDIKSFSYLAACVNVGFVNKNGVCFYDTCDTLNIACTDACLSLGYTTNVGTC